MKNNTLFDTYIENLVETFLRDGFDEEDLYFNDNENITLPEIWVRDALEVAEILADKKLIQSQYLWGRLALLFPATIVNDYEYYELRALLLYEIFRILDTRCRITKKPKQDRS